MLGVFFGFVVVAVDLHLSAVAVEQHLHVGLGVCVQLFEQVAFSLFLRLEVLLGRPGFPSGELCRGDVEADLPLLRRRNGQGLLQVFVRAHVDCFEELELDGERPDALLDLAVEELFFDELGDGVLAVVEDGFDHVQVSQEVALELEHLADHGASESALEQLAVGEAAGFGVGAGELVAGLELFFGAEPVVFWSAVATVQPELEAAAVVVVRSASASVFVDRV